MVIDIAAMNAMTKARTLLNVDQVFFGFLSLQLQLREVLDERQVNTMAVDGKNLYYHPPFVLKMTDEEVKGVVAHEVMHCALRHMTRLNGRDPYIFNMAADFVINLDIKKAGFTLPGQPCNPFTMTKDDLKKGVKGYLYDTQYEGMGTEEVYTKLMQEVAKLPAILVKSNGLDVGGCGSVLQAGSDGKDEDGQDTEASKIETAQMEADWDSLVRGAVEHAKKTNQAGKVPGYLQRLVNELQKPVIRWEDQLAEFISDSISREPSWMRPNRRSVSCGVILPGSKPDAMDHLIVCFDCSGSTDESLMQLYGNEAAGALDAGVCDRMTIIYTDTEVRKVDEFYRGDIIEIKTPGGGGTDFNEVMQWIPEYIPDAGAIVFLTDMYTNSFGSDPGIPVLWGATCGHEAHERMNVPFGRVIDIPTDGG